MLLDATLYATPSRGSGSDGLRRDPAARKQGEARVAVLWPLYLSSPFTAERDTAWAMSQENVEIVRALAESFQRRDHERAFEFYDPEIEWDASRCAEVIPDLAGVYRGHEGVRAYWRRWLSAWNDLQFEVD